MRPMLRANPTVVPAALVALSLAACLGATPAGHATSERRTLQEHEQVVASLMACLEAAARGFAGHATVPAEGNAPGFTLPTASRQALQPVDDAPPIALRPHLSRLNLPPPAATS